MTSCLNGQLQQFSSLLTGSLSLWIHPAATLPIFESMFLSTWQWRRWLDSREFRQCSAPRSELVIYCWRDERLRGGGAIKQSQGQVGRRAGSRHTCRQVKADASLRSHAEGGSLHTCTYGRLLDMHSTVLCTGCTVYLIKCSFKLHGSQIWGLVSFSMFSLTGRLRAKIFVKIIQSIVNCQYDS